MTTPAAAPAGNGTTPATPAGTAKPAANRDWAATGGPMGAPPPTPLAINGGAGKPAPAKEKPAEAEATKPEAPKEPDLDAQLAAALKAKGLKLKAKGKELPVDSLDKLLHYANKAFGGENSFEEANKLREEYEPIRGLLEQAKTNPRAVVERLLGAQVSQKVAEDILTEAMQAEKRRESVPEHLRPYMDENQRLRDELARRDAEHERARAEAEATAQKERLQRTFEEVKTNAFEALKSAGFPQEMAPALVRRLAPYMEENVALGSPHNPAALAALMKEDLQAEHAAIAKGFVEAKDGAGLEAWLGPDVTKLLMRHALNRHRGGNGQPVNAPPPPKPPENNGGAVVSFVQPRPLPGGWKR
jgi:hypothetical protein